MKKLFTFLLGISISCLLSACSPVDSTRVFDQHQAEILIKQHYTTKPAEQMIALNLPADQRWKKIRLSQQENSPIILVVQDNNGDWQERIQTKLASYLNEPNITAQQFTDRIIMQLKDSCPQTRATILQQTQKETFSYVDQTNCSSQENIIFAKAVNGIDAVYVVQYIARNTLVTQHEIKQMAHTIAQAQLVKNPRYFVAGTH